MNNRDLGEQGARSEDAGTQQRVLNTPYRWSVGVESAELDGEWVIMDAEQFTITKLGEVGGFVWSVLQQPTVVAELIDYVLSEYEVSRAQAAIDIIRFVEDLANIGLLEAVS